jgi:hypothetical protein
VGLDLPWINFFLPTSLLLSKVSLPIFKLTALGQEIYTERVANNTNTDNNSALRLILRKISPERGRMDDYNKVF